MKNNSFDIGNYSKTCYINPSTLDRSRCSCKIRWSPSCVSKLNERHRHPNTLDPNKPNGSLDETPRLYVSCYGNHCCQSAYAGLHYSKADGIRTFVLFIGTGGCVDNDLVKLARDLTQPGPPKGSVLEGKSRYFKEIQVGEII